MLKKSDAITPEQFEQLPGLRDECASATRLALLRMFSDALMRATDQQTRQALQDKWGEAKIQAKAEIELAFAVSNVRVLLEWKTLLPQADVPRWIPGEPQKSSSGRYAEVLEFESDRGPVAAKILKESVSEFRLLQKELNFLWAVYENPKAGPHPNLVQARGIALVPHGDKIRHALIMDPVPGPSGTATFKALRYAWDTGKISSAEYWSAVQFIARRLLTVCGHLAKAGIVHRDINPDNFLVDINTKEPILIDFGTAKDEGNVSIGTAVHGAPELKAETAKSDRTDVFGVGSIIVAAVQGEERRSSQPPYSLLGPNEEPLASPFLQKTADGRWRKHPGFRIATDYTRTALALMENEMKSRPSAENALNAELFLNDSMLDDEHAKEAIGKAIDAAAAEEKKPIQGRWNADAASDRTRSPAPCPDDRGPTAYDLISSAERWIGALCTLLCMMDETSVPERNNGPLHFKSGVDRDGVRLERPALMQRGADAATFATAEQSTAANNDRRSAPSTTEPADFESEVTRLVSVSELRGFHAAATRYLENSVADGEFDCTLLIYATEAKKALDLLDTTALPALQERKRTLASLYDGVRKSILSRSAFLARQEDENSS